MNDDVERFKGITKYQQQHQQRKLHETNKKGKRDDKNDIWPFTDSHHD